VHSDAGRKYGVLPFGQFQNLLGKLRLLLVGFLAVLLVLLLILLFKVIAGIAPMTLLLTARLAFGFPELVGVLTDLIFVVGLGSHSSLLFKVITGG
jgi:hypothetical protein